MSRARNRRRARRGDAGGRDARDAGGATGGAERRAPFAVRLPAAAGALALAGVATLMALLVFDPTPHTGGDNAAYLSLARALLQHRGYIELWDPLHPPHTQYPPVFPAILAVAHLLGIGSFAGYKLVIVLFSALAVAFAYLWVRRWYGPRLALGVGVVLALSPGVLDLSHWVLSDVPFWALLTVALWAFAAVDGTALRQLRCRGLAPAKGRDAGGSGGSGGEAGAGQGGGASATAAADRLTPALAVAILFTLLAYFTRSAGLPLVVAAGVWLLWKRRWRSLAALVVVVGVPAALWWLRARTRAGVDYVQQFMLVDPYDPSAGRIGVGDLVHRMGANLLKYVQIHVPVLVFGETTGLLILLGLLILAAAAVGWVVRVRRGPGIAELFLPLYLGLLLVWPAVWSGERFLLPALPVLLALAGLGLLETRRWLGARGAAWLTTGAAALVVLAGLPGLSAGVRAGMACTTAYRAGQSRPCMPEVVNDYLNLAQWSKTALPDDAAVISRKPTLFYWFSGHPSRIYPKTPSPKAFFDMARRTHSRYVVIDRIGGLTSAYVVPVIVAYPQAFCIVHVTSTGVTALLGLTPEAQRLPDDVPPRPSDSGAPRLQACPASYSSVGAGLSRH